VNRIVADLGDKRLVALQPADVRAWIASLREAGYEDSTIGAFYSRLSQLYTDAVHDGLVKRSPLSRRTSPGHGKRRAYVATEAQVWGLYDLMPEGMKAAIALGAFAGLRIAEAVALRVEDIQGGEIRVSRQYPDKSVLKTSASAWPVPVGPDLVELLGIEGKSATDHVVLGTFGRPISPYRLEEAFRLATLYGKPADDDEEDDRPNWLRTLPEGFRFHDLRHYYASFLIAEGLDVKAVQACMRHESATTTLNKYGHMFPSKHDDARRAISGALARRGSDSAD
jgi:integrase